MKLLLFAAIVIVAVADFDDCAGPDSQLAVFAVVFDVDETLKEAGATQIPDLSLRALRLLRWSIGHTALITGSATPRIWKLFGVNGPEELVQYFEYIGVETGNVIYKTWDKDYMWINDDPEWDAARKPVMEKIQTEFAVEFGTGAVTWRPGTLVGCTLDVPSRDEVLLKRMYTFITTQIPRFNDVGDANYFSYAIDLVPKGHNKAVALEEMRKLMRIDTASQMVFVGDAPNDVPDLMLELGAWFFTYQGSRLSTTLPVNDCSWVIPAVCPEKTIILPEVCQPPYLVPCVAETVLHCMEWPPHPRTCDLSIRGIQETWKADPSKP